MEFIVCRCPDWSPTCRTHCALRLYLLTVDLETFLKQFMSAVLIKVLRTSFSICYLTVSQAIVIGTETQSDS